METLTDFKPIRRIVLPGLGELRCSGLTIIVGPNSSGKSQLLRDIKEKISGEPRDLVVATDLDVETPDLVSLLRCLKEEGYIYSTWDANDQEHYVPRTTFLGTGQGAQNVASNQLEQWRTQSTQAVKRKRRNEYFGWASKYLVTALFLENRLTSLTAVSTIDFETQPPINDLHALHLNDTARAQVTEEIQRAFSKAIWSDISRGSTICLRIGEKGSIPDAETRLSVSEMANYRTIETEGDGMKSYVATVISLLLGRRPVTVIDEPEMCLHPPQCYNLGQFIGKTATSDQTATFVATHSSQILRGVIQEAEKLQIVRLSKNSDGFVAKLVDSAVLADAMKKPTVRGETVLDGIFSQAVTIIEGDGDRIVYQAAWEAVGRDRNFDIHFTTAGGTGGIADTCNLYRILDIPVVVIADLDVIIETNKMRSILQKICSEKSTVADLMSDIDHIAEQLLKLPPTIDEEAACTELRKLASQEYDWSKEDDRKLREELSKLRSSLNGMRGLKRGGLLALPESESKALGELLVKLRDVGIFIVPCGELEEWLSDCSLRSSKSKKWAWANEASEYIGANPPRDDDIWQFVRDLGGYLAAQFSLPGRAPSDSHNVSS